jgi:predicted DNA-binding transcriptional regulator AlpA
VKAPARPPHGGIWAGHAFPGGPRAWRRAIAKGESEGSGSKRVLSLDEVAKRTGLTRRTLERLLARGEGPVLVRLTPTRIGVLESDLDDWISKRRSTR